MTEQFPSPQPAHTPWRVDSLVECPNVHIIGADGRTLAVAFQRDDHPRLGQGITVIQAREHACLMAAAPELLEVLQMVQEVAIDNRGEDFNLTAEQWSAFHAAIAKAKGATA